VPKTFPIKIEVEEFALGAVLRRLHEMQGIAKLDLLLGHGGDKPIAKGNGHRPQDVVMEMLATGPKSRTELTAAVHSKNRLYAAVNQLKKKHLIKRIGADTYALTQTASKQINGALLALPPPIKRGKTGRASPGSTMQAVIAILTQHGPARPMEIAAQLSEHGVSPKSLSGVLNRALRDSIVKRTDGCYSVTAKATKESA
jgi:DNA-binding HxlR family transcriptional regulator